MSDTVIFKGPSRRTNKKIRDKGEEENLVPASWSSSAAYVCSPLNHPLTLLHSRDQDTDLGLREGPFSLPSFSMMLLVLEALYALPLSGESWY